MTGFRNPHTSRDLSRMLTLQAGYLRKAGLMKEAAALARRAEEIGLYAATMEALRSAPIRLENGARA